MYCFIFFCFSSSLFVIIVPFLLSFGLFDYLKNNSIIVNLWAFELHIFALLF